MAAFGDAAKIDGMRVWLNAIDKPTIRQRFEDVLDQVLMGVDPFRQGQNQTIGAGTYRERVITIDPISNANLRGQANISIKGTEVRRALTDVVKDIENAAKGRKLPEAFVEAATRCISEDEQFIDRLAPVERANYNSNRFSLRGQAGQALERVLALKEMPHGVFLRSIAEEAGCSPNKTNTLPIPSVYHNAIALSLRNKTCGHHIEQLLSRPEAVIAAAEKILKKELAADAKEGILSSFPETLEELRQPASAVERAGRVDSSITAR